MVGFVSALMGGKFCAAAILGDQIFYHFDNFWRAIARKHIEKSKNKIT
jgi:hypothetical protein